MIGCVNTRDGEELFKLKEKADNLKHSCLKNLANKNLKCLYVLSSSSQTEYICQCFVQSRIDFNIHSKEPPTNFPLDTIHSYVGALTEI